LIVDCSSATPRQIITSQHATIHQGFDDDEEEAKTTKVLSSAKNIWAQAYFAKNANATTSTSNKVDSDKGPSFFYSSAMILSSGVDGDNKSVQSGYGMEVEERNGVSTEGVELIIITAKRRIVAPLVVAIALLLVTIVAPLVALLLVTIVAPLVAVVALLLVTIAAPLVAALITLLFTVAVAPVLLPLLLDSLLEPSLELSMASLQIVGVVVHIIASQLPYSSFGWRV